MNEEMPQPSSRRRTVLVRRHSIVTRLTHWLNVLCLSFLLLSGLQIFNAYPRLHWGQYGADADRAFIQIGASESNGEPRGFVTFGGVSIPTTGVLGLSKMGSEWTERAFPGWLTLPSYQDLAAGRRWHFFFAWLFVINGFVYLACGLLSGHFRRDLTPDRRELGPRHVWREIIDHARLRFPEGEQARHYNVLQKLTYIAVIAGLLPLMVLTGLTMSPGMDAAFPFLLDIFGGRQSARTLHFICASLLVLFVVVHVAMVVLSGPWNNMRSMVTGRYAIRQRGPDA
ncbi:MULTISPECIES: cytochrome b/b6 domain-containing protein [unclassified Chelatococcus]|uniref:cytochrome b/b6 domain-containing protein n=1 Tax=unclassified Chelatococcus TaxID=2638111 RepID=UPI001BD1562C|nr:MULTISPECIES: cytochrome b/b6 domain-containing protein [unclassified Chelatococcus]CAH1655036.1 Ni_hydr_CYTB domain-containing protein [Hyphomicrobiales bacterium]MBS7742704.1 cytochrome b/b6 domain-containing protein [Chelatococcus sp. HY11]MBX3542178.1 cytochrome b/b6 domain-containing protein [Chelatococcus sp.]MCO5075606.1 cytochrome b/b6 domain-containing protein [Chelatococcus sp.]CAH1695231.1 Ni_hydr_CYTB domain-containing protein [Hyphomicrobiales bacterium]